MFRCLKDDALGLRHLLVPLAILAAGVMLYARSGHVIALGDFFPGAAIAFAASALLHRSHQPPSWWSTFQRAARMTWTHHALILLLFHAKLQLHPNYPHLREAIPLGLLFFGVVSVVSLPWNRLRFADAVASMSFLSGVLYLVFRGDDPTASRVFVICVLLGYGALLATRIPGVRPPRSGSVASRSCRAPGSSLGSRRS